MKNVLYLTFFVILLPFNFALSAENNAENLNNLVEQQIAQNNPPIVEQHIINKYGYANATTGVQGVNTGASAVPNIVINNNNTNGQQPVNYDALLSNNNDTKQSISFNISPSLLYNINNGGIGIGADANVYIPVGSSGLKVVLGISGLYNNVYGGKAVTLSSEYIDKAFYGEITESGTRNPLFNITANIGLKINLSQKVYLQPYFGVGYAESKVQILEKYSSRVSEFTLDYGSKRYGGIAAKIGFELGYSRFYIKTEVLLTDCARKYTSAISGKTRKYGVSQDNKSGATGFDLLVGFGIYLF